jgi:hypothetical protein
MMNALRSTGLIVTVFALFLLIWAAIFVVLYVTLTFWVAVMSTPCLPR